MPTIAGPLTPQQALKQEGRRVPILRSELDRFKRFASDLIGHQRDGESEEYHKTLVAQLLRENGFQENFFINSKGRADLVIHNGPNAEHSVAVIVEAKSPKNRSEMPSDLSFDCKAMQELVLYYLRERFAAPSRNLEIRRLIITNSRAWYIFDATVFEAAFARNDRLVTLYLDFQAGRLAGTTTDYFYREIASPAIRAAAPNLTHTKFTLDSASLSDDKVAAVIMQLLSPSYLLKLANVGPGNVLDDSFYKEFLYILGLQETKVGSRRLITRVSESDRQAGSFVENAIARMRASGNHNSLTRGLEYPSDQEQRLFSMAMELSVTWMNRILFVKLLEAQMLRTNEAESDQRFLTPYKVKDFAGLQALFFEVLAQPRGERASDVLALFGNVPYLNSSLFEPTHLEREVLSISALRADMTLKVYNKTSLVGSDGKRSRETLSPIEYLFRFLDSFDFSSNTLESEIRDDNRPLISSSVLGLIFEKINGYKDGSFYTPGSVTTFLARDTIRSAIVSRFNTVNRWNCKTLSDVYNRIESLDEANRIVESVRICDPSVGSGHFLVSALNELLLIKSELRILRDCSGNRLKEYELHISNDEVYISDEQGETFRYRPRLAESRRVQEAIFAEKRRLIENCLFGVDINSNSVHICRLRLWIELLKSAFYRPDGELETLPNIDINIKTGDALFSRFTLDSDLSDAFKGKRVSRKDYLAAVRNYQGATSKAEKSRYDNLVSSIKGELASSLQALDPKVRRLNSAKSRLDFQRTQGLLFSDSEEEAREREKLVRSLELEVERLTQDVELARQSFSRRHAFEWRFEFPEVLDEDGRFIGFDVVLGNPPYGIPIKGGERESLVRSLGAVPDFEIAYWFITRARMLLRNGGLLGYIVQNSILFNVYAADYRAGLLDKWKFSQILDCSSFQLFPDAIVRNAILIGSKEVAGRQVGFRRTEGVRNFPELLERPVEVVTSERLKLFNQNWGLVFRNSPEVIALVLKLQEGATFEQCGLRASQGYIPYRRSDLQKRYGTKEGNAIIDDEQWHASSPVNSDYVQELRGGGISRYKVEGQESYVWYGKHVASYIEPEFFSGSRVIVREITSPRVIATLTDVTLIGDPQTISLVKGTSGVQLECVWAYLNSRLATFFHANSGAKVTKGLFPKILVEDVRNFPMPPAATMGKDSRLLRLAILSAHLALSGRAGSLEIVEAEIDREIYNAFELSTMERQLVEDWCELRGLKRSDDYPVGDGVIEDLMAESTV